MRSLHNDNGDVDDGNGADVNPVGRKADDDVDAADH